MSQFQYGVGSTRVPLILTIWNVGTGEVLGVSPKLSLRRVSDNKFLDFNDNTFKTSGVGLQTKALVDINSSGRYQYMWPLGTAVPQPVDIAAEYQVVISGTKFVATDTVTFTSEDSDLVAEIVSITENTKDVNGNPLGPVVSQTGGTPLIGARVQAFADTDISLLTALFETIVTDGSGKFSLQVVKGGIYRIAYSFAGYQSAVRRVQV